MADQPPPPPTSETTVKITPANTPNFANTPFTFSAPNSGTASASFPGLGGFGEALAAVGTNSRNVEEEDDDDDDDEEEGESTKLPAEQQTRVDYLEKLQKERAAMLDSYRQERTALESKYRLLITPLQEKRAEVIAGRVNIVKDDEGKPVEEAAGNQPNGEGIPNFWLTALCNCSTIADMMADGDEHALQHLLDIKATEAEDYRGFKLEFFFQSNPYFSNSVLTKEYEVDDLFVEQVSLRASRGTLINWLPGKNLCVDEKRMKPKGRGRGGVVVKQVPRDSFFNFFAPVEFEDVEIDNEQQQDLYAKMEYDYAVADKLRTSVVPDALTWFNDEAGEDDDDDDDDDYDEDEDDDDDGGDEDDSGDETEEEHPSLTNQRRGKGRGRYLGSR